MTLTLTDNRVLSAQELSRMAAAIAGTYVVPTAAGGAVSASAGMVVAVAAITAGNVVVNGTTDSTGYAGGTVTISTADVTNPRRDYVYYDGAGTVGVTAGTAAANPVLPDLTAGRIALAEIYVAANDTAISGAGEIIDKRANVSSTKVRVVGQNTTEQTRTTNTEGDMVTIAISPSITAAQGIRISGTYRKSTGAAAASSLGLKLNSTAIVAAGAGSLARTSANDTAQAGSFVIEIEPRATNYLHGITSRYSTWVSATGAQEVALTWMTATLAAALITADITSIVLTGISGNSAITLGIKDVLVEAIG